MDSDHKKRLMELVGKGIAFDRSMALHTTFQVGGPCDALYQAENPHNLENVMAYAAEEHIPLVVIGRGSNLLVKNRGIRGLVIMLKGALAGIRSTGPNDDSFLVGAGLALSELLNQCREHHLGGLEWAAGIPGTVGGAVCMNAGAYGEEFGSLVQEIHVMNRRGETTVIPRSRLHFSYRHLDLEKGSFIAYVKLTFKPDTRENIMQKISTCLKKRRNTQPLEFPSAGSVFKNPPDHYAGRLIEEAGLKGKKIGGAMVSRKHANFIVNIGGATAQDILDLMVLIQTTVEQNTGTGLVPEIQVVGE